MLEFLTLGGLLTGLALWGFWLVVIVVFGVFVALTEGDHWGWASTLFVGVFAALGLLGLFNLWKFALAQPLVLLEYVGGYILCALIYGAIKWYVFCRKQLKKYEAAKADFLKARRATEMTPELRVEWTEKLRHQDTYDRYHVASIEAPKWREHKEKIATWMYLWPFSIVGTMLTDFMRELWNHLCKWMGGIYDNIANMVWKDVSADLASEEDIMKAREAAANAATPANVASALRRTSTAAK